MSEAGHESVEEDRRGFVSERLFRVHLRRLQLESSRGLFAISVRTGRQNKLSVGGRESTKSPQPRCAKMRTASSAMQEKIVLSPDRKARPRDCFLHLAARQRQNICSRRLFHQSALAERSAELVIDFAFTTDESIQGVLSV